MDTLTSLERQIDKSRRAAGDHPEDLDVLLAYARLCLKRDLRLEALQVFQRVLEVEPRPEARSSLAQLFARQSHFAESYEELRRLFELEPRDVQGHALLHWLQEREPVPEDLVAHLEFRPTLEEVSVQREALEAERDTLRAEVDQYRSLTNNPDPEPILLYHLEESRKRVERVSEVLERLEEWQKLAEAVPEPVEEPVYEWPPVEGEEVPAEGLEPEAEEGPAAEAEPVEAVEELPAEQAPARPSEEREAFYATVSSRVAETLGRIGQTRGVVGSLVMALDPWPVCLVGEDQEVSGILGPVAEGVRSLLEFQENLQNWVLECEDGIVVVQRVDERHLLVVIGKAGANFGALRYAIDKNRSDLAEILSQTPAA